jgi:hypothetical protein
VTRLPRTRAQARRVASVGEVRRDYALPLTSAHAANGRACRRARDPGAMSVQARLAELGELLAAANRRARVRGNRLDGNAVDRACISVDGAVVAPEQETT